MSLARNLDTGQGSESVAGEPSQAFVDKVAVMLPHGEVFMDMGSCTGCFLGELGKKRPDLTLHGVEADEVRFKMAQTLHMNLPTKLVHQDILHMASIDPAITTVFAHDTAWTHNVVAASTLLVLSSPTLQTFICVKPRPELVESGQFIVLRLIPFTLRGGNTTRVASVYTATTVLTVARLRTMIGDNARGTFQRDFHFYLGTTEKEKRKDLEVRPSDHFTL